MTTKKKSVAKKPVTKKVAKPVKKTEISKAELDKKFMEICESFAKLQQSINHVSAVMTEGIKSSGVLAENLKTVGSKVDEYNQLNTLIHSGQLNLKD